MLRPYSPHEVDHSWIGRVWPYLVLQMLNLCGENACHADTEGSFMVDRVEEIADACVRHLKKLANNNGTPAQEEAVHMPPTRTPAAPANCSCLEISPRRLVQYHE